MEDPDELLIGYEEIMYRHDLVDHIAGRIEQLPERVLCTRRHVVPAPSELAKPLLRRAGFEYVAYMRLFDHDYALISALLGLSIDGDLVSGYMTGWELYYQGQSMEVICQELLGAVPGTEHAGGYHDQAGPSQPGMQNSADQFSQSMPG
ncbi:hypothetical protein PIB30_047384 [Stylosanthes scabra]|uniref:Uncharacterized protein n=1 Tax=Stylosanthes scabra TaxID=79078 RepID=A0ABU6YHT4_9FABA|nr:hypothetical protein [Stylosanthes scabra]